MKMISQATLKQTIRFAQGVGVHSGKQATVSLHPANPGQGIVMQFDNSKEKIPCRFDHVSSTQLCTSIQSKSTPHTVHTIEHLCAALYASGIHNVTVGIGLVEGKSDTSTDLEIPIFDGSAKSFVDDLLETNVRETQQYKLPIIRLLKEVSVSDPESKSWAKAIPLDGKPDPISIRTEFSVAVGFGDLLDHGKIRNCNWTMSHCAPDLRNWLKVCGSARTFGFLTQLDAMKNAGLAKGGSLHNCVVFPGDGGSVPLNPEGLRYHDEWVRHKLLDLVGDCSLLGNMGVLHCGIHSHLPGHSINNKLMRTIFEDKANYEVL